jgi:predicted MPP superfamily phosphohydrolase
MHFSKLFLIFIISIFTLGCGGTSGSSIKAPIQTPETSGVLMTVSDGLSVNFDSGLASFELPSESISIDTLFKASISQSDQFPDPDKKISNIYILTPEKQEFSKAATLTLTITKELIDGKRLLISQFKDNKWINNLTSVKLNNSISAKITELGVYAIRYSETKKTDKTIGPQCDESQLEQSVRFIHVADLHSRFGYEEQLFSKIKAYHINALKEQAYTLFTNGGDDYEKGTVAEQTSNGFATVEAIKAMEFDARVVGNHDYAWGAEQLIEYANDTSSIVLASNTQYIGDNESGFSAVEFAIVQVGCIKIGLFGMTSVPWNELDEPLETAPIPDFLPEFKMNWQWQEVAQSLMEQYRGEVDYMVMLSHMGIGSDTRTTESVSGIDLALGGHTHGGESISKLDNGSIIIQPNFFAQGVTDIELIFDTKLKNLKTYNYKTVNTNSLETVYQPLVEKVEEIMGKYAPDANTLIAVSENYPTKMQVSEIVAKASQLIHQTDAALLDSTLVQKIWTPGGLTQELFHEAFKVERQRSNTPGFNSLYQVIVSGFNLKVMANEQPTWFFQSPININDSQMYKVLLHKGAALNPNLFFANIDFESITALSETWFLLDKYARYRTSQCRHLDTETILNSCIPDSLISIWNFNNIDEPLKNDFGPSQLKYYDPASKNWGPEETKYDSTLNLNISPLSDGDSGVMSFSRHKPTEAIALHPNTIPNGDFKNEGWISDYTIVMDLMWPTESDNEYRAILQTNINNSDDADLYVNKEISGGVGITTRDSGFFGNLDANKWYRIAIVFYAAPEGGVFKVFIDGKFVGEKDEGEINDRWAIKDYLLLFTDNDYETKPGYLNSLLFAGRAMTSDEVQSMQAASKTLSFTQTTRSLNQIIKRHYQKAPINTPNPWLEQRKKFFGDN